MTTPRYTQRRRILVLGHSALATSSAGTADTMPSTILTNTSTTATTIRPRPGPTYSGSEVPSSSSSSTTPMLKKLKTTSHLRTSPDTNKDGSDVPRESNACPLASGSAGSPDDGSTTKSNSRILGRSLSNIDQALQRDAQVKDAARTNPNSRVSRLQPPKSPIEHHVVERSRSRSR